MHLQTERHEIHNVAIVGGTHGNELLGIFLLKKWEKNHELVQRPSFQTQLLLGNPKGAQNTRRFVDVDLNRSFSATTLANDQNTTYEETRAQVINQLLGPKDSPKTDLIIDIHTTTSNMGVSLILFEEAQFNLYLAAYIQMMVPGVKIILIQNDRIKAPYLSSVSKFHLGIEAGPVSPGLVRHDLFEIVESIVFHTLDCIETNNKNYPVLLPEQITVYEFAKTIRFPVDSLGEIAGIIHKDFQDKDFDKIKSGMPIFQKFDGDIISYSDNLEGYAIFINEAAYYSQKLAFTITTKRQIKI